MQQLNVFKKSKARDDSVCSKDQQEAYQESVSTLTSNVPRLELLTEWNVPVCKPSEISGQQHKASFQYLETLLGITFRLSLNECWLCYYQEAEEFSKTKKHWQAMQSCCLNCIFLNMDKNTWKMLFLVLDYT